MEIVFTVLILMLAVAASGVIVRVMPVSLPLPLPLVQIAMGALLAWPKLGLHVAFNPDIFMLLFIPPLLFADGWRIPKREFFMARRSILMLALGLVFITVLAGGYFVHALVPSIALPVAFALAAVLSPTDAVALSGIAGNGRIPGRLMHILEGEALMNDASGLVALKFAIAAALTGVFSLRDARHQFRDHRRRRPCGGRGGELGGRLRIGTLSQSQRRRRSAPSGTRCWPCARVRRSTTKR